MNKSWVKFGLIWGTLMAIIMNIGFPLFDGENINWAKAAIGLPVWLIFGLIFGYVSRKKPVKKQ